jgi:hypothetical protein
VNKGKIKEGQQQLTIKPFVQNVATTSILTFPEENSVENAITNEPDKNFSDPAESMDGQEAADI